MPFEIRHFVETNFYLRKDRSTHSISIISMILLHVMQGRQEGGGGAEGAKYLGPGLVWGARNLYKTSGHCATVKRVGGP